MTAGEGATGSPGLAPGFRDEFVEAYPPGSVPDVIVGPGVARQIIDAEGRIGIDHRAIRFSPLCRPGWGRQGVAYGPFRREPGLAFSVQVLNGHNGSHSGSIDGGLRRRFRDWLVGPGGTRLTHRLLGFLRYRRKRESFWLWRWWLGQAPRFHDGSVVSDNLLVGWTATRSPSPSPSSPTGAGHTLLTRTNTAETGLVVASVPDGEVLALPVVMNVPTHYLVVLRDQGAIYLGASIDGVGGLPARPLMRPLAIDPGESGAGDELYAGVHQRVLGQVGFGADTRIPGAAVDRVDDWAQWWSTAHVADRLDGTGGLSGSTTDHGHGRWSSLGADAGPDRSPDGLGPSASPGVVCVTPDEASGLAAVRFSRVGPGAGAGLVFRVQDENNHWGLELDGDGASLFVVLNGIRENLAVNPAVTIEEGAEGVLQVSDDGARILAHFGGESIPAEPVSDRRLGTATGVGVAITGTDMRAHDFEAHPRTIEIPESLRLGSMTCRVADTVILGDDFTRPTGDLTGGQPGSPLSWRRLIGEGVIETTGSGHARVRATIEHPNPGRTAYAVPWSHPDLADLEVLITPPGTRRGEGHQGRAGVIFWQDPDHFVIVNNWLDDSYPGASISMFCRFGSFEEIFRAVWSNVGSRVSWGVPHRLRVACDGVTIVAKVDEETVLYRALHDVHADAESLAIRNVGIVANWEWGDDTGSSFGRFVARGPAG